MDAFLAYLIQFGRQISVDVITDGSLNATIRCSELLDPLMIIIPYDIDEIFLRFNLLLNSARLNRLCWNWLMFIDNLCSFSFVLVVMRPFSLFFFSKPIKITVFCFLVYAKRAANRYPLGLPCLFVVVVFLEKVWFLLLVLSVRCVVFNCSAV